MGGHLIYPQRIYHFRLSRTLLGDWVLRHLQWTRFVFGKICATRLVENVDVMLPDPNFFSKKNKNNNNVKTVVFCFSLELIISLAYYT